MSCYVICSTDTPETNAEQCLNPSVSLPDARGYLVNLAEMQGAEISEELAIKPAAINCPSYHDVTHGFVEAWGFAL